jgi:hypothetical protein
VQVVEAEEKEKLKMEKLMMALGITQEDLSTFGEEATVVDGTRHTFTCKHAHTHTHSLSLSLSRTHTHTHTHTHAAFD